MRSEDIAVVAAGLEARVVRRASAIALVAALTVPTAARVPSSTVPARPDDRTIVHVLNRAGFGPRPGDVAQVREMGLEAWLDQQLHPERIVNAGVEARLRNYETLDLSSREIAREYFLPAREARKARKAKGAGRGKEGTVVGPNFSSANAMEPEILRAKRILVELSAQKIVRAVYSDRQLEEVLTDFCFNHFNGNAGKVVLTELFKNGGDPAQIVK